MREGRAGRGGEGGVMVMLLLVLLVEKGCCRRRDRRRKEGRRKGILVTMSIGKTRRRRNRRSEALIAAAATAAITARGKELMVVGVLKEATTDISLDCRVGGGIAYDAFEALQTLAYSGVVVIICGGRRGHVAVFVGMVALLL